MLVTLFAPLLGSFLSVLFPGAPKWIGEFVVEVLAALVDLVEEAGERPELRGHDRLEWVVNQAREAIDDAFDDVPEWSALSEARRDRIVGGLAEFVLFVSTISSKKTRRKLIRRIKKLGK